MGESRCMNNMAFDGGVASRGKYTVQSTLSILVGVLALNIGARSYVEGFLL